VKSGGGVFIAKIFLLVSVLPLGGCLTTALEPSSPTFESVRQLQALNALNISVGSITSQQTGQRKNKVLSVRGNTISAPNDGTFADYLKETLKTNLIAAGRFDEKGPVSISGALIDWSVTENMSTGRAALTANFTMSRGETVIYEKTHSVETTFTSNFIAAIAVPAAFDSFNALFPKLAASVLSDPELKAALLK
jgi:hypothetical protein